MENDGKKIINEMITFCRIVDSETLLRYDLVKRILAVEFYLPEFDILRNEIGRCYVVASYHACITLTNHLLERYCKMLLICYESGFKTLRDLKSLESIFENANKKYMNADLNKTLNACLHLNLITKEERVELDRCRDVFRNGYSHASANKILGNAKGNFALGSFDGKGETEIQELTFSKIPIFQGIAIENFSQVNALPYFIDVENLIRKTIKYIQSDENIKDYGLVRSVN